MVYICNGVLYSLKNEDYSIAYYHMNEPQGHYEKNNKCLHQLGKFTFTIEEVHCIHLKQVD